MQVKVSLSSSIHTVIMLSYDIVVDVTVMDCVDGLSTTRSFLNKTGVWYTSVKNRLRSLSPAKLTGPSSPSASHRPRKSLDLNRFPLSPTQRGRIKH